MKIYLTILITTDLLTEFGYGKCHSTLLKKKGKVELIGLFPVKGNDLSEIRSEGLVWVEAMKFSLNKINRYLNEELFGYSIYDTCGVDHILTSTLINILLNSTNTGCLCSSNSLSKVIGIIGPAESSSSIYIHKLLSNEKIAIVSYYATSVLLSDKSLYPNFFRSVPPDSYQSQFITSVLLQFGWKYVSLVASDNAYGREGIDYLTREFAAYGICVNERATLSDKYDVSDYLNVIKALSLDKRSKVVIVWGWFYDLVKNLLINAQNFGLWDQTWIISEATGFNPWLLEFAKSFRGNILLTIQTSGYDKEFENNFLRLSYSETVDNPWLKTFFQSNGIIRDSKDNVRLSDLTHSFDFSRVSFVENAVHVLVNSYLKYKQNPNKTYIIENRTEFNAMIKDVSFPGFLNEIYTFDEYQNPTFANFQLFLVEAQVNKSKFKNIASWSSVEKFTILELSLISNVTSICSTECAAGEFTLRNENKKCCWECVTCFPHHVKPTTGEGPCEKCKTNKDFYPNLNKTKCIQLKRHYWKFDTKSSSFFYVVASFVLASIGLIIASLYGITFVLNRHSPVARSSNFRMSIFQQLVHLGLYTYPIFMIGEESRMKCYLRTYLTGICFTTIYTLCLLKVTELVIIFNIQHYMNKSTKLKLRSKVMLIFTLIISTYIILIIIIENNWPLQVTDRKDLIKYTIQKRCDNSTFSIAHIIFNCTIFLGCFYQSFRGRKLPGNYNEAKYIGFAIFSSTLVSIVSLVTGSSFHNQDDFMFFTCVTVILSNTLILLILFTFKIYIIWFKPEQNTRKYFCKIQLATLKKFATRQSTFSENKSDLPTKGFPSTSERSFSH